jgi:small subunit ribosomal protein S20
MPRHKSAVKRARQNIRRAVRNKAALTRMKSLIRKVRTSKTKDDAAKVLRTTVKYLDEIASKGVIHKNKASNQKSKLTKLVNAIKGEEKAK